VSFTLETEFDEWCAIYWWITQESFIFSGDRKVYIFACVLFSLWQLRYISDTKFTSTK
jgi:hypothetical protein